MGGNEAAVKLLEIDPEARIIASSGYSNDPVMSNFRDYGFADVVAKPYTIRKIGKVLRDVITEKRIHIMKTMKLLEEVSFPY